MGEFMKRGLVALALLLLGAGTAQADGKGPGCVVRVIHAQTEGNRFDPQLASLRPQLTRPPLSTWKSFRLLQSHDLQLTEGQAAPFALPGEHSGVLTYEGTAKGSKERLRFKLELKDGPAKLLATNYVLNDGGTIMQVGIKHENGMLILGITCKSTQ